MEARVDRQKLARFTIFLLDLESQLTMSACKPTATTTISVLGLQEPLQHDWRYKGVSITCKTYVDARIIYIGISTGDKLSA